MKKLLPIPLLALVAAVAYSAYVADQWLGVVAFTYRYLLFCVIGALVLGGAWFGILRKRALLAGLAIFILLAANFLLPPPSERLLRSVMLETPAGTEARAVERIVKQVYEGSAYKLPGISRDRAQNFDRLHVSLSSQEPGNSTSLLFLLEEGVVVESMYLRD